MKQVAFRSSNGDVTRLGDALCWRFLEGRPCLPAAERRVAASVDVVIIPVMPASAPQQHVTSTSDGNISPPAAAQDATSTGTTGCKPRAPQPAPVPSSTAAVREELLRACASASGALGSCGLRAAVDDCPKATPGAKYNLWENRGVRLRVEVGMREVASGRFCLVLHPSCSGLMPGAKAAAEAAENVLVGPLSDNGAQQPGGGRGLTGSGAPKQRSGLRLPALSLPALAAACKHVTSAATKAPPTLPGSTQSQGGAVCSPAAPGPEGHGHCRKLHLWPDAVNAAAADPVAAIIAQLRASYGLPRKSQARGTSGGGPPGGALADMAQEVSARVAAAETQAPPCGGAKAAAAAAAPGAAAFRPCVAHLRHLLQLGRACHCGQGHCTLQELQHEVAVRYAEANRHTGAEVADWILPAVLQVEQVQQQKGRPRGRQDSSGNAGAAPGAGDQGIQGGCEDCSAAPGSEDGDGGGGAPGGSGRVVLLVGDIPPRVPHGAVQGALAAAFQPFGCLGVAVSRAGAGGTHGWARVALADGAAAAEATKRLDGQLVLAGCRLSVGPSCGRADALFPHLPHPLRAALRIDPTAAYSATDHATADAMTHLLAELARHFLLPHDPQRPFSHVAPPLPSTAPAPPDESYEASTQPPAAGPGAGANVPSGGALINQAPDSLRQSAGGSRGLGPNPLEARQGGSGVVQVPVDGRVGPLLPLRVADGTACCGGNALSLVRRFAVVTAVELDEDRAEDLRHNAALVRAWAELQEELGADREPPAAAPDDSNASVLCPPPPTQGGPTLGGLQTSQEQQPCSTAPHGWQQPTPQHSVPAGAESSPAAFGELRVLCADYTRVAGQLQQHLVFLDPPWGGPQYQGAQEQQQQRNMAADGSQRAQSTAAEETSAGISGNGRCRSFVMDGAGRANSKPVTAFMLGDVPLGELVGELLASGKAGMVALKLPGRAVQDVRQLEAAVRHQVEAGRGARGGGMGACGAAGSGQGGARGAGAEKSGLGSRRQVLCVEVTMGRSVMVVFLCCWAAWEEEDDDNEDEEESGDEVELTVGGGSYHVPTGVGLRVTKGAPAVAMHPGALFRRVLRETCVGLGLPYRVVYD